MLYTLQIRGSERVHYIFGTIHLGSEEVNSISSEIKEYIEKCNYFYGEMDITRVVQDFYQTFYLPNGQTIKDLYPERKFAKMTNICQKHFGINLFDFISLKPLFIVAKLGEVLANHSGKPMDAQLFEHALNNGLMVGGLESPERQMEIAALLPLQYQAKMLAKKKKNVSSFKLKNKLLLDDYFRGNVNEIYKKSKRSLGSIRTLMLYERNFLMAEEIDKLLAENNNFSHFFCFGAAHLGGQKGVLAYLKRKGYVVKIVN